jgi:hypothetical protein
LIFVRQGRLVRALVLVDAAGVSGSTLWNINVAKLARGRHHHSD